VKFKYLTLSLVVLIFLISACSGVKTPIEQVIKEPVKETETKSVPVKEIKEEKIIDVVKEEKTDSLKAEKDLPDRKFDIEDLQNLINKLDNRDYNFVELESKEVWDKYGIDVRTMEKDRDEYTKQLDKYLVELGYEK
jgi:Na+-transporting methylmalonyl-CoA/oxaloacetate decarboxylase gamma subunit